MSTIKTRDLATMAGIPDTVPFEALCTFSTLIQQDVHAALALFNHKQLAQKLRGIDKALTLLTSKTENNVTDIRRIRKTFRENGIEMTTQE